MVSHSSHRSGLLLLPNAKTVLTRSPRIALKIKEPPRSQARRIVAEIKPGRGAARPVGAAAPGGAGGSHVGASLPPSCPLRSPGAHRVLCLKEGTP